MSFHTNGFHTKAEKENFLLCAQVVVRASSFKFSSFGGLRKKIAQNGRGARAAQLFFLIRPIRSLFCDVVDAVVVS